MPGKVLMVVSRDFSGKRTGRECVLSTAHTIFKDCFDEVMVQGVGVRWGCSELRRPSLFQILLGVVTRVIFFRWSFSEIVLYSNKSRRAIESTIYTQKPDLVYVDTIRLYPLVRRLSKKYKFHVHVDYDDLFSRRYANLAGKVTIKNLLGNFQIPFSEFVASGINRILPILLKFESKRLFDRERVIAQTADSVSFVSQIEAESFVKFSGVEAYVLPMGFSSNLASSKQKCLNRGRASVGLGRLVYLGDMTYSGNVENLRYILKEYREVIDRYGLDVVGRYDDFIKNECSDLNVRFKGFVDNLENVLTDAKCMFVPMCQYGGIKTKILESFFMRCPVVTNSVGVEGLAVSNGRELFICENNIESINAIAGLSDKDVREKITKSAWCYAVENFEIESIKRRWYALFNKYHVPHRKN